MISDLQNCDTRKIQLTIAINFISTKDLEEEHVIHSRSNNIKFISYNGADEVDELFESLRSRYQGNLETSMRGSYFIFDSVHLMYYKCHKVNFRSVGSYINSPEWIKKKKGANLKNTDDECALNYEEIKWNPERVSNVKPFINKYNWKGINHLSKINDWKMFEKNISTIALDILYIKEKEVCRPCISKINSNCEKKNDSK